MTLAILDWRWGSTMGSIIGTYIIDQLFVLIRHALVEHNLAAKTLVDDRFLV